MANTDKCGKLRVVFGDVVLGVHGDGFDYLFSYATGGMESLVIRGREWLYRTPAPTFWRATTDNDRGNGFSRRSAMWLGADLFRETGKIHVSLDGYQIKRFRAPGNNRFGGEIAAKCVGISFRYRTATKPHTYVTVSYSVEESGRISVEVHYYGKKGLPQLPVFGMRFIMPTAADGYSYTGLSGETYPDRMAGGELGTYEVKGLPVTPYLVPQDCGVHMETELLTVKRSATLDNTSQRETNPDQENFSLTFEKKDAPFAFTCLPYTSQELENATHQEELPPARRTVVCILGAVRGVGGIDSWGSDVEPEWQIDGEKDMEFGFYIAP